MIRLQQEDFDLDAEIARLTRGRTDIGAVATFTGICRGSDGGERVIAMTLEHYPGMAEAEIARHVEEAEKRWPLLGVTVIHRYGRLVPGENVVLVVTASSHREAAFAAAELGWAARASGAAGLEWAAPASGQPRLAAVVSVRPGSAAVASVRPLCRLPDFAAAPLPSTVSRAASAPDSGITGDFRLLWRQSD